MLTLPNYQPHKLTATRLLAGVGVANAVCFALANFSAIPVLYTPLLYIACLLIGGRLFFPLTVASQTLRPSRLHWILTASFIIALILPRGIYPLEWLHGQQAEAVFDDYARIAELASMTLSGSYPLLHPANDQFLLSFYYAAFYPAAVLKLSLPLLTIKDALFLSGALYAVLLGLSLLEITLRSSTSQRGALLLLFLCTWFGGLDWLTNPLQPVYSHSEWWALEWFDRPSQISGWLTASQWSIHHFLGCYLAVCAWALLRYTRGRWHWQKRVGIPLLLVAAFQHSPFGFLPVVLLGLPWLGLLLRRYAMHWQALLPTLVMLLPLPVFFGRLPGNTLQIRLPLINGADGSAVDYLIAAAAYLIALPLVDLAGLPLLLVWLWKHFSRLERQLALGAALFFVATLFLHMPLFNNFSMRGMLLPSFIIFALLARHFPTAPRGGFGAGSAALAVVLLLGATGGIREFASQLRYAAWADSAARQALLDQPAHPDWLQRYYSIARDNSIRVLPDPQTEYRAQRPYLSEKRLPQVPARQFTNMERELARRSKPPPAAD